MITRKEILDSCYKDEICMCVQGKVDGWFYPYIQKYLDLSTLSATPTMQLYRCSKCHKLDKIQLQKCVLCASIFFHSFEHPYYGPKRPACWHCLQDPAGKKRLKRMSNVGAIPPPEHLIQPKVRIKTLAEKMEEIRRMLLEDS